MTRSRDMIFNLRVLPWLSADVSHLQNLEHSLEFIQYRSSYDEHGIFHVYDSDQQSDHTHRDHLDSNRSFDFLGSKDERFTKNDTVNKALNFSTSKDEDTNNDKLNQALHFSTSEDEHDNSISSLICTLANPTRNHRFLGSKDEHFTKNDIILYLFIT